MKTVRIELPFTYRLDLHPEGGVTVHQAAQDAWRLACATGLSVDVIHNDRRYHVELVVTEDVPVDPAKVSPQ